MFCPYADLDMDKTWASSLGYLRQYCDPVIQVRDHCLLFVIYVAKVPVVDAKATRTKKL